MKEMNVNFKLFKVLILFGIVIIFLFSLVSAGIASRYYSGNPLVMSPGETLEIEFGKLQNLNEGRDVVLKAELLGGGEIAEIIDDSLEYPVPLGEKNVGVNMRLSIPKNARDGESYSISAKFSDITPVDGEGTVVFAKSFTWSIPVLVQVPEEEGGVNIFWILVGIVLLIFVVIIIYLIIKRRNELR